MAKKGIRTMKLLQLNEWGGRLGGQVADLLKVQQTDFVCLQEAVAAKGDAALSITTTELQEKADYPHAFNSPVFSFNLMSKKATFGNAILSKLPFSETNTIFTNLEYTEDFDFDTHDYNIRNLQHVIIDTNGQKLHILNHHGHHVHQHKEGDEQTLRQMKQIAQYISTLEGPTILTGDFNLSPTSESIGVINALLRNLSTEYGLTTTRTQLTAKKEVCDYIFVSDTISVSSFKALDDLVSDHKALLLEFEL
jgi:endonuclease/exonuclease/phosphatase family metal-dependent hydrolase